jgi:hypothetical protein
MRAERLLASLTVFTIYLIPIIGIVDFLISIGVIPGTPGRGRPDHPFPLMIAAKEGLALILFVLLVSISLKKQKVKTLSLVILMAVGLLSVYTSSLIVMIAGFRQSVSFVYIVAGKFLAEYQIKGRLNGKARIIKGLKIVLIIEFVFAVLQTQYMPCVESMTFLGAKPIGSFTNPNALGIFGAMSILMLLMLKEKGCSLGKLYYVISGIIVISSSSRIATLLFTLVLIAALMPAFKKLVDKPVAAIISAIMIVVVILNINFITHKPPNLSVLKGTRMMNLVYYIDSTDYPTLLFGQGWGILTSWYFALKGGKYTEVQGFVKLDSFYAAIMAQIGFLGLFLFGTFLFWLFSKGGKKGMYLFIVFCITGVQGNVLEHYPLNFLIFMSLGICIAEQNARRMHNSNRKLVKIIE